MPRSVKATRLAARLGAASRAAPIPAATGVNLMRR